MSAHSTQIIKSSDKINLIQYAEAIDVGYDTETTIITYTATQDTNISMINCSGDAYAKFKLYVDTNLIGVKRTGPDRNINWKFNDTLFLVSGSIIDIKVTHYVNGDILNFESGLYGFTN